jgi:hypothetical protein
MSASAKGVLVFIRIPQFVFIDSAERFCSPSPSLIQRSGTLHNILALRRLPATPRKGALGVRDSTNRPGSIVTKSRPRAPKRQIFDCQKLSLQPRRGNAAASYRGRPRFLLRAYWRVGHVSCGINALTSPPLSRRVHRAALAVPGRCNSFEERRDLADYPICIPSSAEPVASGTSRKARQSWAGWPSLERFWQLRHGDAAGFGAQVS